MNVPIDNTTWTSLGMFAIFGLLVGLIIHLLDHRELRGGMLGTILFGVLGALAGGIASTFFFGESNVSFTIQGIAIALLTGLLLALISRVLLKEEGHIKTTTMKL